MEKTKIKDLFDEGNNHENYIQENIKTMRMIQIKIENEKDEYFDEELHKSVGNVRNIKISNTDQIKDFVNEYQLMSENEQSDTSSNLTYILNLGMYMRGWKGGDHSYPLKDCKIDPDDVNKIHTKIEQKLIKISIKKLYFPWTAYVHLKPIII